MGETELKRQMIMLVHNHKERGCIGADCPISVYAVYLLLRRANILVTDEEMRVFT